MNLNNWLDELIALERKAAQKYGRDKYYLERKVISFRANLASAIDKAKRERYTRNRKEKGNA